MRFCWSLLLVVQTWKSGGKLRGEVWCVEYPAWSVKIRNIEVPKSLKIGNINKVVPNFETNGSLLPYIGATFNGNRTTNSRDFPPGLCQDAWPARLIRFASTETWVCHRWAVNYITSWRVDFWHISICQCFGGRFGIWGTKISRRLVVSALFILELRHVQNILVWIVTLRPFCFSFVLSMFLGSSSTSNHHIITWPISASSPQHRTHPIGHHIGHHINHLNITAPPFCVVGEGTLVRFSWSFCGAKKTWNLHTFGMLSILRCCAVICSWWNKYWSTPVEGPWVAGFFSPRKRNRNAKRPVGWSHGTVSCVATSHCQEMGNISHCFWWHIIYINGLIYLGDATHAFLLVQFRWYVRGDLGFARRVMRSRKNRMSFMKNWRSRLCSGGFLRSSHANGLIF